MLMTILVGVGRRRGNREEAASASAGGHGETETISESNEGSLSEFAWGGREPTIAQAMSTIGRPRPATIHHLMDGFRHASMFDDSYTGLFVPFSYRPTHTHIGPLFCLKL